ncbi:MAG TPA: hypothetical protein VFN35_33300 [Ktedonobacteraceae bacterium]|nr:hypothetical protein [Ktedonobacteraceae bacterium]
MLEQTTQRRTSRVTLLAWLRSPVSSLRNPISFSVTPSRHTLPPPAPGQDNEQIRAWLNQPWPADSGKRKTLSQ